MQDQINLSLKNKSNKNISYYQNNIIYDSNKKIDIIK